MRKLQKVFITILFFFFLFSTAFASQAHAVEFGLPQATKPVTQDPDPVYANSGAVTLTFRKSNDINGFDTGVLYILTIENVINRIFAQSSDGTTLTIPVNLSEFYRTPGQNISHFWKYNLYKLYQIPDNLIYSGQFYIQPPQPPGSTGTIKLAMDNGTFLKNTDQALYIENVQVGQKFTVFFDNDRGRALGGGIIPATITKDGVPTTVATINMRDSSVDKKRVCVTLGGTIFNASTAIFLTCDYSLDILVTDIAPVGPAAPISSGTAGVPANPPTPIPTGTPKPPPPPCSKFVDIRTGQDVTDAIKKGQVPNTPYTCTEVDTAFGSIPTETAPFIRTIFTILLSMAGGWAVVLIILAGYQLLFSQGEAEATKEAKEKITSAIVGIVFMILSYAILYVIGVQIFKFPTFGP